MSRNQSPRADPLGPDVPLGELRGRSLRGGLHAISAQWAGYAIELAALAALARLLSPEDFGLLAMTTAVLGLLAVLKDLGLPAATLQREGLTEDQVCTLFWANAGLSVLLVAAAALLAPALAAFFGDSRLLAVTAVLGLAFLFAGLEAQHVALLRRRLRFRAVAWSAAAARGVGAAAAVAAALAGWGYWALVVRALVTPLANTVFVWLLLPWRPGRPGWSPGAGSLLRFGGYVTAHAGVNHVGRNFDNVLIGRLFGGASLGLYAKAYELLLMPVRLVNDPISAVAVPALARLQREPERLRSYYYKALSVVVTLSMPLVAWLAATTDSFVLLLLGEQWRASADLFRILAIPAFVGTLNVATGWIYLSTGRVREQLVVGCVNTAVGIAAISIGAGWGVAGVAWALAVSAPLRRLPTIAWCYRGTPFTLGDLGRVLWRPALAAIGAGLATHALHAQLAVRFAPLAALALCTAVFAALYALGLTALPGGRALLAEVRGHVRVLGGRAPAGVRA